MQNMNIHILAIESSCDDTSCAVLRGNKVLSNETANQKIHAEYGGVVPELASRDHQKNIIPVIDIALKNAGVSLESIEAIAVTRGPGLLGSLLVGLSTAQSMALALNIPLIEVDHMQAHILAHFIDDVTQTIPDLPLLCLTVSGGHTQLVVVKEDYSFELIGETLDDAVGEAFDKAAKLLGLPYPGGPIIDKLSQLGDSERFKWSKPNIPNFDYSFSGVKTAFLYWLNDNKKNDEDFIEKNINDICASYQRHLCSILIKNLEAAVGKYKFKQIALAGGVSANSELRRQFLGLAKKLDIKAHLPNFAYCTDNAAMIGIAGLVKYMNKDFTNLGISPKTTHSFCRS
ncbi:MAG: tRNA (adenosine(37)-N6)-threonylcarbamoyltransferase complex transferase subunit TsaD [Bacteroidia bacterium]